MSIHYRVVIECDSCGEEEDMAEDLKPITAPPKLIRGWKANVEDSAMAAQYGHACAKCQKDIKDGR